MAGGANITGISGKKRVKRRRFLRAGAAMAGGAAVAAAAAVAKPGVSRARTTTLRMQGAWGPADIFHEMALEYVSRVEKMAGGRLKIDYSVAGSVIPPFRLHEAVHNGRLDAGHAVTAYWRTHHKAASLFGGGPVFGADAAQTLAWIHKGGGHALYRELVQDILKRKLVGFLCMPAPDQPLGWFARDFDTVEDLRGRTFAFGDRNSTIGRYLSQLHLMEHGIRAPDLAGYAASKAAVLSFVRSMAAERALLDRAEVEASCRRIANKLASVTLAECRDSRLEPTGGRSVQGTPILPPTVLPVSLAAAGAASGFRLLPS